MVEQPGGTMEKMTESHWLGLRLRYGSSGLGLGLVGLAFGGKD